MTDTTWEEQRFQDLQALLRPLEDKVRSVLLARGFHENNLLTDRTPGFRVFSITPLLSAPWVEVAQIDVKGANVRPAIAEYQSALQEAGFDVMPTVPHFPVLPDYVELQIPYPYNRRFLE